MNLKVVRSLNNGSTVMERQFQSLYFEIDNVLRLAGPGASLSGITKYLCRYGWAGTGSDARSFTKERVKVDLRDTATRPGNADAGAYDANVVVALSPAALQSHSRANGSSSMPTVVVAPASTTLANTAIPQSPFVQTLKNIGSSKCAQFRIGNPGIKPTQEAQVRALITQARNLRTKAGQLTQGALLVRAFEESGLAIFVTIYADFAKVAQCHGETGAVNDDGTMYGTAEKAQKGESTSARIDILINGPDAVAPFAHEVTHAAQFIIGFGHYADRIEEWEPTRIGNEAYESIGYGHLVSDTYRKQSVPEWNRYIPWVTSAPQHF